MLAEDWEDCVEIARDQTRDGAHLIDLCVDYVGRDGVADMAELAGRLATAVHAADRCSTRPSRRCSRPAWSGSAAGRSSTRSTSRTATGPDSRFRGSMALAREHGAAVVALRIDEEGQARTAEWKVADRRRLIDDLATNWGMRVEDIVVDTPHLPDRHRAGGDPPRRAGDDRGDPRAQAPLPRVQTTLGLSNISFGLNAAARQVLNSVFLHECVKAGLDSAIVHAGEDPADGQDPTTSSARSRSTWSTTARRRRATTRCSRFIELFEGVDARRREGRAAPRSWPRCRCASGWSGASSTASATGWRPTSTRRWRSGPALEIINDMLLDGHEDGRRAVRLGADAAAVRAAVGRGDEDRRGLPRAAHGEGRRAGGKGTIVLATVKGDVHDIGKNLVDIILTNNGYRWSTSASSSRSRRSSTAAERARRRRDRHVRAAGEVDGDHEGEPRGDELPRASPARSRCCSAARR